jgi:hypothetical protein
MASTGAAEKRSGSPSQTIDLQHIASKTRVLYREAKKKWIKWIMWITTM